MAGVMKLLGIKIKKPKIAGFSIQSSIYGLPIPIVYGTARIAGNILHQPKLPTKQGGGKGQSKSSAKGGQNDYVGPLAIALCEGPIFGILQVWQDQNDPVPFSPNFTSGGWSLFTGTTTQSPWSYLTSNFPNQALNYPSTAYVANASATFPNNQTSQLGWEVQGFLRFVGTLGTLPDANPAAVVADFLTSAQYGANLPSSVVGDTTNFFAYCAAAGLLCSPAVTTQSTARDLLNEMFEVGNTAAVWSDGILKFIPYGDTPLTGNGYTYTPNTTPLYDLGDNDFLPGSSGGTTDGISGTNGDYDPISVARTDPSTAYNIVPVAYEDRLYSYNSVTLPVPDDNAVNLYGPITMSELNLPSIKTAAIAQQVGYIRLQRELYIRNTYTFTLTWKYSLLEPMDLITLTDPDIGLNKTVVRITSMTEQTDDAGWLVTAEDWPFGSATATAYDTGSASGMQPNTNVDPGDTNAPFIVEGPTQLFQSPLDILVGASGGADWGGCEVYVSTDNVNFSRVGTIFGPAAYGITTASLATGTAWPGTDSVNTLAVDISATGRTLDSYSSTDFNNLVPLCYVGGEWVAFETATLTGGGLYSLTTLYRGLYNSTIPSSHSSGVAFALIDDSFLRVPWPQGYSGQTLYFKLPAFNIYGAALQDLSAISSTSYTVGQDPITFERAGGQGTVAIDTNGSYSATAERSGAQSFKWLASTSAYPTDASVISGGTVVNGNGVFSITAGGTLTFGQTVYITIIPYNYPNAVGAAQTSIHIRGAYQTYTPSITDTYNASSYISTQQQQIDRATLNGGICVFAPTSLTGPLPPHQFQQLVLIPPGATITNVIHDLYYDDTAGFPVVKGVDFIFYRIDAPASWTSLATGSATNLLGWQSISASLSETSTGKQYFMQGELTVYPVTANNTYTNGQLGGFSVTYTQADPTVHL